MIAVVPPIQCSLEVTFDSPSLDVGISIYDTTSTPVLVVGPVLMALLVGNTYFARFTPTAGHQYVIMKGVYTTSGLSALDPTYQQASEALVCKDNSALVDAIWDEPNASHVLSGSMGESLLAASSGGGGGGGVTLTDLVGTIQDSDALTSTVEDDDNL